MRVLKFLLALPVGLVLILFGRRTRWVTAAGVLAFAVCSLRDRAGELGAPVAPRESLTPGEVRLIFKALLERVRAGGPNHLHSRRLYYYAQKFADEAGANVDSVRAAALLHDSAKEKEETPGEKPEVRFCHHGERGSQFARDTLVSIGKSKAFADHVAESIVEHMGPCGYNWKFFDKRFMSKYCPESEFPKPQSIEARVLFDIDMLDLMTVDGIVKVVQLRQGPGFKPEPIKDSAKFGKDSAWKSVVDASQVLTTPSAKSCGGELVAHSEAFLDGVDWEKADTVDAFKLQAKSYLAAHPLPDCLPKVPT